MKSSSSLLLGACTCCGEPIFRHRLGRRQITCEQLRRLDQEFRQSGAESVHQAHGHFQIIPGGRDRVRAILDPTLHAGEV